MKTVAFTSGFEENVLSKNKSALWFKCLRISSATCQNSRSKLDLRPDRLFIPLKLSPRARCQKLRFTGVKQGSEAMGSAEMMKHAPQLSCQMLKMGSSGRSSSTQGVYAWKVVEARWLKSALREARCNQAFKMRMTTSTPVDWGCLAASLSAGHHQERLLGQPLWPYCGFKFPFEGGFVS